MHESPRNICASLLRSGRLLRSARLSITKRFSLHDFLSLNLIKIKVCTLTILFVQYCLRCGVLTAAALNIRNPRDGY